VDRKKLVETMDGHGFDPTVTRAYAHFCHKMTLRMPDGQEVISNLGVV